MYLKIFPLLLICLLIGSAIEIEMLTPSFVAMAEFFAASPWQMSFVVTANLLGFIVAAFFLGPVSEVYGRKKVLLMGQLILLVGAGACLIAPNLWILVLFRFVQGMGAATALVLVPVIVADVYSVDKAEKFYKIANFITTSFTAIAPVLGGFINEHWGWRINILVLFVVELGAFLMAFLFFRETKKTAFQSFSLPKILEEYRLIFRNRKFLSFSLVVSFSYLLYFVFITYAPFIYIETFEQSSSNYAWGLLIFLISYSVFCLLALKVKGSKTVFMLAGILNVLGFVLMFGAKNTWILTLGISIHGIASAFFVPSFFAYTMDIFPDQKGIAASAMTLFRNFVLFSGLAGVGLMFNKTLFSFVMPLLGISCLVLFFLMVVAREKGRGE